MKKEKKDEDIEILGKKVKLEELKSSVQRIVRNRKIVGPIDIELKLSEEDKKKFDPTASYYNVYKYAFF